MRQNVDLSEPSSHNLRIFGPSFLVRQCNTVERMTYVIGSACVEVMDKSCVQDCPVDCFYEGDRTLCRGLPPNEGQH
jgi:NAD-dependent dihydropyrimidine dehydrogenase PreA subunit